MIWSQQHRGEDGSEVTRFRSLPMFYITFGDKRNINTKVQLEDAEDKLDAIMQTVLTKEDIYRTLNTFSEIYDQMTDFEKKTFLRSFVKSVEIYPDKSRKHGCYVKSIDFLFPVSYHGKEVYKVNLSKPNADGEVDMSVSAQFGPHTESVVTLIRTEKGSE